jgi:hypothetical protein
VGLNSRRLDASTAVKPLFKPKVSMLTFGAVYWLLLFLAVKTMMTTIITIKIGITA